MKSILLSVQPKWCELIASGKKTVEIRKFRLETPFKVYIYQTKKTWVYDIYSKIADWQGKVIGEFICENINQFKFDTLYGEYFLAGYIGAYMPLNEMCLTQSQLIDYGDGKPLYGLHISELKIYDKPKELSEFKRPCNHLDEYEGEEYCDCLNCDLAGDSDYGVVACDRTITRPPQSYCYVEELTNG